MPLSDAASQHSRQWLNVDCSVPHLTSLTLSTSTDADSMSATFVSMLRVLGSEGEDAACPRPPSVTAAALSALGNLLEGTLTRPGLW